MFSLLATTVSRDNSHDPVQWQ